MKAFLSFFFFAGLYLCNAKSVPTTEHPHPEYRTSEKLAFVAAVKSGDLERYKALSQSHDANEMGGKNHDSALHYIAEHGNDKLTQFMIEKGADVNLEDDEGLTPVHFAALNPDEKVMDTLIKHGADVNHSSKKNETPLHLAALNSNEKVMELLLANGANANVMNDEEDTPLHWAAANLNEKVLDLLLKKGVDLNLQNDDKDSALHIAAFNNNEKVAQLLVEAGANVNLPGNEDWTPIFYAVTNGNEKIKDILQERDGDESYAKGKAVSTLLEHFLHPTQKNAGEKIIELLLNNKANINQKATDNLTPYDIAHTFTGDEKMEEFLLKHGANRT